MLRERMKRSEYGNVIWNDYSSFAYDAAWAVALALNKTVETLKTTRFQDGLFRRLEDFTYDDQQMAEMILDALNSTSFDGVSVRHKTLHSPLVH